MSTRDLIGNWSVAVLARMGFASVMPGALGSASGLALAFPMVPEARSSYAKGARLDSGAADAYMRAMRPFDDRRKTACE